MLWLNVVAKGIKDFWGSLPRYGVIPGKYKDIIWMVSRKGILNTACTGPRKIFIPLGGPAGVWLETSSFAGGLRPAGAARLSGVLCYYTRGPNL